MVRDSREDWRYTYVHTAMPPKQVERATRGIIIWMQNPPKSVLGVLHEYGVEKESPEAIAVEYTG
jgi:hypothetical protein